MFKSNSEVQRLFFFFFHALCPSPSSALSYHHPLSALLIFKKMNFLFAITMVQTLPDCGDSGQKSGKRGRRLQRHVLGSRSCFTIVSRNALHSQFSREQMSNSLFFPFLLTLTYKSKSFSSENFDAWYIPYVGSFFFLSRSTERQSYLPFVIYTPAHISRRRHKTLQASFYIKYCSKNTWNEPI